MPSLPIPLIASAVLAFLAIKIWQRDGRYSPLGGLIALFALQALIIALSQHYGLAGFGIVQAINATLLPACAWLAFQITAIRNLRINDCLHLIGPAIAIGLLLVRPTLLDVWIPLLFVFYGCAILWQSWGGSDALPRLRIQAGDLPARLWVLIGAALVASAMSDVIIVAANIAGKPQWQPWIISIYSMGNLILIGALSLSDALQTAPEPGVSQTALPSGPTPEDGEVMQRLEAYMAREAPYLDPDLTLTRLARKLGMPAKPLSAAINRSTGQNVSRYVNAARVRAAQRALAEGENVTNAMLSSGFNTKSNFNREFLRITGTSPTEWLDQSKQAS